MELSSFATSCPKLQASERRCLVAAKAHKESGITRRSTFLAILAASVAASTPARALIPMDDAGIETEEFKARVRENKAAMVDKQRQLTRNFLNDMNQPNAGLEAQIQPMQAQMQGLRRAGKFISEGNLKGADNLINSKDMKGAFETALRDVNLDKSGEDLGDKFLQEFSDLQAAVKSGDVKSAKAEYVAMVDALKAWSEEQNTTRYLEGLTQRKRGEMQLSPGSVMGQ